jgi:two-component sensor histidine kinase/CheY-like chemotaxis protein
MPEKILIIDDDPLNIKLITAFLKKEDFDFYVASDGNSGINKAIIHNPDLIILDALMPELNGFETCRRIKKTKGIDTIPVIFLTALTNSTSVKLAFEAGAVDYVTKPIEFIELLARVKTHLKIKSLNNNLEIKVNEKTVELQKSNEQLKKTVQEREILLKELYHRTKNNMQVISSMLSLHSMFISNTEIKGILKEIDSKVQSMALVHKKLYQTKDLTNINLREYIVELVDLIQSSYDQGSGNIDFKLDLEDTTVLIDTAISCGLIINELISNSFKYAFPDNQKGIIYIELGITSDCEILLRIGDDGIGIPDNFNLLESETLGVQTIIGISENQLKGKPSFINHNGLGFELIFKDNLYENRLGFEDSKI